MKDLAPEHIRAISPYVAGKPIAETARELGLREADILKMASNENPLGSSPRALAALRAALGNLAYYPDGAGYDLKAVITRVFGIAPEHVVLGNGSNDVLELVARAFLTREHSVVFSKHAFMVYPLVTQAMGAKAIEVPTKGYDTDLDGIAAAMRPDTRIVFVANPNNPTGTFTPWGQLRGFIERTPPQVIVVIDEAYGEYLPPELQSPAVEWLAQFPNLVLSRTLSKAYGLAGLRVGFGLAHPEVAELMNRVRQPFNVNHLAMVAATAALEDHAFIESARRVNAEGLRQLEDGFRRLRLEWIPSFANFITVKVGDAAAIYAKLLAGGVIVRPIANYGLPEHLRITVGLPEQNARFLTALAQALGR